MTFVVQVPGNPIPPGTMVLTLEIVETIGRWHGIENWIDRLKYTLYHRSANGPELLTNIRCVHEKVQPTEIGCSPELTFCLAVIAARRIRKLCCCPNRICPIDRRCATFWWLTGVPELEMENFINVLLIKNFGTKNLAKIHQWLEENKLQKLI